MKKYLILSIIALFAGSCLAMCPIDDGNAACAFSNFRENVSPIYNPKSNISEFSSSPEVRLNPVDRSDIGQQIREFAPMESDFNYNSSCQFGVCMKNRNAPLFQQKRE